MIMLDGKIYGIQNIINIKIYIGQTSDLLKYRWASHIRNSKLANNHEEKSLIHCAIAKYGIENFNFICIEEGFTTQEELNEAEQFWIAFFRSNVRNLWLILQ